MNSSYTQIKKLDQMLKNGGIPHEMTPYLDGYALFYRGKDGQAVCTVVQHYRSQGGGYNLLEMRGLLTRAEEKQDSAVGYLAAQEVYDRIIKHWEENHESD